MTLAIPSSLSVTARAVDAISLTWNTVPGASHYDLQFAIVGQGSQIVASIQPPFRLTGLQSVTEYTFVVRAQNNNPQDVSPFSGPVSAFTMPPRPVSSPVIVDNALLPGLLVSWQLPALPAANVSVDIGWTGAPQAAAVMLQQGMGLTDSLLHDAFGDSNYYVVRYRALSGPNQDLSDWGPVAGPIFKAVFAGWKLPGMHDSRSVVRKHFFGR